MSHGSGAPSVEIREVDRERPEETGFVECFAIRAASAPVDRPWAPPPDYAEHLAHFRHVDDKEDSRVFVAWAGEQAVGTGVLHVPLADNTDKAYLGVLVHPGHRRRGVGTSLAHHLIRLAHDEARYEVLSTAAVSPDATPDHPARSIARSLEFELANTEIARQLAVPVDPALLQQLAAEARPHYADRYRLVSFTDGVAENLVPGLCAAMNRLPVDAPTGGIDFEAGSFSPEQYHAYLALGLSTGGHQYDTLAITSDGEVAAYSSLFTSGASADTAQQGGTLVTAPHRGHRLGMGVKIANLQLLADQAPQVTRVMTDNAEQNGYMVSINVALGFKIIAVYDSLVRRDPVG